MGESDTPLIDHLVMRELVSGPPSYRFIYERVRDKKPSLRKGSWAVCGFRTEFFEKRQFFGSSFSFYCYFMFFSFWYKRACIGQSTRQPSVAVQPFKKDVKKKFRYRTSSELENPVLEINHVTNVTKVLKKTTASDRVSRSPPCTILWFLW